MVKLLLVGVSFSVFVNIFLPIGRTSVGLIEILLAAYAVLVVPHSLSLPGRGLLWPFSGMVIALAVLFKASFAWVELFVRTVELVVVVVLVSRANNGANRTWFFRGLRAGFALLVGVSLANVFAVRYLGVSAERWGSAMVSVGLMPQQVLARASNWWYPGAILGFLPNEHSLTLLLGAGAFVVFSRARWVVLVAPAAIIAATSSLTGQLAFGCALVTWAGLRQRLVAKRVRWTAIGVAFFALVGVSIFLSWVFSLGLGDALSPSDSFVVGTNPTSGRMRLFYLIGFLHDLRWLGYGTETVWRTHELLTSKVNIYGVIPGVLLLVAFLRMGWRLIRLVEKDHCEAATLAGAWVLFAVASLGADYLNYPTVAVLFVVLERRIHWARSSLERGQGDVLTSRSPPLCTGILGNVKLAGEC